MVDDPAYRAALLQRMINGTAGTMEPLMWYYAKGKPQDKLEVSMTDVLRQMNDEELKLRLAAALKTLQSI